MKCLFLYNPNSGKGRVKKKLPFIEKTLRKKFDEVVLCATQSAQDLEEQARLGAEQFEAIVFSGGDGTFNNILHGVGEKDVLLGYLPTGTANDVAHSLGIPRKRLKGALKVILKGRTEQVDCMRVNGVEYAMYVAAAGAFTSVTYSTPQKRKRKFGWLAYAFEALKTSMKFGSFPVKIICGERTLQTDSVLILVMSGRTVAGFPVNSRASMQDGILEVAVVKKNIQKRGRVSAFFSIIHLFLFGRRVRKKSLEFLSGSEITVETQDSLVWDFDGEKGVEGSVKIEVLPRRVKMFVPQKKKI